MSPCILGRILYITSQYHAYVHASSYAFSSRLFLELRNTVLNQFYNITIWVSFPPKTPLARTRTKPKTKCKLPLPLPDTPSPHRLRIKIHIIIRIPQRLLHRLNITLTNLIIRNIKRFPKPINHSLLLRRFLHLAQVGRVLATRELDVVEFDLLAAGQVRGTVGFKTELGDEVGEDLVEDTFGEVEGLGGVAVAEEELRD